MNEALLESTNIISWKTIFKSKAEVTQNLVMYLMI